MMSSTLLGWFLVISSTAILALQISSLRSSSRRVGQLLQAAARKLMVPATAFLLVAGVGAATLYVRDPIAATSSSEATSPLLSPPQSDGELLAGLTDYTRSIGTQASAPVATAGDPLPDVNTMIERLVARLKTAPDSVDGWRMLGWSYLNTGAYQQAASAYAKALELDPSSAELKRSYEDANSKAAESGNLETVSLPPTKVGDAPSVEKIAPSEAMSPRERDAAIRSMVDRLAARLENFPRDVEGWIRLMRSRAVLGETELAAAAFRKALDVFKDDPPASNEITAAASELGLRAE